ncbi:MAG: hypothetical protein PVJ55_03005 [Anaerolineae bacterium]|jgi:hypothetical protein
MNVGGTPDRARRPRGVIGCLTAGFEMLTHSLHVVGVPVVLDLILWLGPRVSIGPLLQGFVDLLGSQPPSDPEIAGQIDQAARLLQQFGDRFNLLSVLGGVPMFQVPSLLARRAPAGSPLGARQELPLSSVLALIPWWGTLALIGLVLGFFYLNEIAHQVGDDGSGTSGGGVVPSGERPEEAGEGIWAGVSKFLRFLAFALGLMAVGFIVFPLWVLLVALGASIAQPLGVLMWVAGVGLLSYTALHLVFVVPGLLLGERGLLRAIGESVMLSHFSLSSVLGFVLLAVVIYEGLGYAWALPASDSWAMLIGIVGHAFVGTGLTGAAFVFYRDRVTAGDQFLE